MVGGGALMQRDGCRSRLAPYYTRVLPQLSVALVNWSFGSSSIVVVAGIVASAIVALNRLYFLSLSLSLDVSSSSLPFNDP